MVSVTNKSAPVVSTTGNFVSLSLLSGSVQQENGIISRDLTVRRAHSTTKDITCFDFHSTELKKTGGAMSSRANVESLTISPPIYDRDEVRPFNHPGGGNHYFPAFDFIFKSTNEQRR